MKPETSSVTYSPNKETVQAVAPIRNTITNGNHRMDPEASIREMEQDNYSTNKENEIEDDSEQDYFVSLSKKCSSDNITF